MTQSVQRLMGAGLGLLILVATPALASAQRGTRAAWTTGLSFIVFQGEAARIADGAAGIVASRDWQTGRFVVLRSSVSALATVDINELVSIGGPVPTVPVRLAITDVQLLARPVAWLPVHAVVGAGLAFPDGGANPMPRSRGLTRWGLELGVPAHRRSFAVQLWRVQFAYGMAALRSGMALSLMLRW